MGSAKADGPGSAHWKRTTPPALPSKQNELEPGPRRGRGRPPPTDLHQRRARRRPRRRDDARKGFIALQVHGIGKNDAQMESAGGTSASWKTRPRLISAPSLPLPRHPLRWWPRGPR